VRVLVATAVTNINSLSISIIFPTAIPASAALATVKEPALPTRAQVADAPVPLFEKLIVGAVVYPVPGFVTVIDPIESPARTAVAAAPLPPPPVKTTVGTIV
jgi:hypothetical protein